MTTNTKQPTLAFSTNAFTRHSLTDALNAIADAGFRAVEILADVPHAFVRTLTESDLRQIRQTLTNRKLAISNVNANCTFGYWKDAPPEAYFEPSLISPSDVHRNDRISLVNRTIEVAHDLGAQNVSITTGRCTGAIDPQKAAPRLSSALNDILTHAHKHNVNIGIELEPGLYLEFVEELRQWIAQLNHPRFGANLDIGHSVVNGERIDESILTLAGRIWNLHVEDLPGRKHYHTIPGDGSFDWQQLRRSLAAIDYDRFVTVELYTMVDDPHAAARRSYDFLSRVFTA